MPEEIPRRLLRFNRKKPSEQEVRARSSEIAINEVDRFRERHSRFAEQKEREEISDNVFEQLKRELAQAQDEEKEAATRREALGQEENPPEKSLLEKRRERRGQREAENEKQQPAAKSETMGRRSERNKKKSPIEEGQAEGENLDNDFGVEEGESLPELPK